MSNFVHPYYINSITSSNTKKYSEKLDDKMNVFFLVKHNFVHHRIANFSIQRGAYRIVHFSIFIVVRLLQTVIGLILRRR